MKYIVSILCINLTLLLSSTRSKGQVAPVPDPGGQAAIWEKIAPYFSPPAAYQGKYGSYRSPLKCYNGDTVETDRDWEKRRREILTQWNKMMGEWPPLLKDQRMTFLDSSRRDGFTQYRVRFKWTPKEYTTGYLLIPDGEGKKPAVITVFYEPETAIGLGGPDHPYRDFAYQLARRGFITLSIGTTAATQAKTYALYYPDIRHAAVQPLSMLACAAANAWYALSKVPEVDSTRIGIMGHSFGGKWAMFASCLFDKFACAVWSDPGIVFDETREAVNYWEPWYLGYHPPPWRKRGLITKDNPAKGLYPRLVKAGYDLQELHALMAPRPFLVSGGSEDTPKRWIALNHAVAVNRLLGYENRVAMTNRPAHSPTQQSNEIAYLFFTYFLKYNGLTVKNQKP
ncbi:sialidase [Compostibacter hankyongensis]|uniref:Prolyl oligopeptidase family serine peptidase n=1 Tax=Compostibacter hankyongensis TaxID=1007089 RepID=A0ABP8G9M2_9BACT